MKLQIILAVVTLLACSQALPQLVGISSEDFFKAVHRFGTSKDPLTPLDQAVETGCDYDNFVSQLTQWTVDAGLSQGTNYTNNGQALKDAVNAYFAAIDTSNNTNAQIAMDKFCITQRKFFQQLGVQQVGNCLLAVNLVANGYDKVPAYQTQQVFAQLNYQCGPAFKTYTDQIQSYLTAAASNQAAIDQCGVDFINNLNSTTFNDHGCSEMQIYEHCVGKIYSSASKNIELGWTVCEAVRRTNVITLPSCRDSSWFCDLSQLKP